MTRLMVLGLLKKQPMSGYEIQRFLQLDHVNQWAEILPGSIYHALKKLESESYIEIDTIEHTGNRAKATYIITDQGEQEYARLIEESLSRPSLVFPTDIYTALLFHGDLAREQVLIAVESQIDLIRKKYDETRTAQAEQNDLSDEEVLIFDHMYSLFKAHLKLLNGIRLYIQRNKK
ncbi:PadR family transcriptional regulator [Paenibacillus lutrae]|uniref:PadR family transcriptional regulator n=1 Tax=Paenibacillus lutrae TaxID=2078573 RepID=A0A7X3FFH9_9BACL|nr:PadR family transcriptional regulator [Paenibacillus lutrae]MVO98660.1 PadR family transcriptional regulator [Paenibacillus lutrae]